MLRTGAILVFVILTVAGSASAEVFRYAVGGTVTAGNRGVVSGEPTVVIYSSTDQDVFTHVIEGFQRTHAGMAVVYFDLNTLDIHERILEEARTGMGRGDLVLSSAIDLQIKLVNDGLASPYRSPVTERLPPWALWRDEAFGFTFEPVVIVYNKDRVPAGDVPRTRYDLARLLGNRAETYFGKVATYDPERSGAGFLFVTQDARESEIIWALARSLGANGVKLYNNTGAILDRIATGQFLIGYNVLGSYALARARKNPAIGIVFPEDYALVMSRIALIPKSAPHPDMARKFLNYLLSENGQRIIAERSNLYAIHPDVGGEVTAAALRAKVGDALRPIRVGPGLLVYLDRAKRQIFLKRWRRALQGR